MDDGPGTRMTMEGSASLSRSSMVERAFLFFLFKVVNWLVGAGISWDDGAPLYIIYIYYRVPISYFLQAIG